MKKKNEFLQNFVTYAVKNLIDKIKILIKSEIIAITPGNIEVLLIYYVI